MAVHQQPRQQSALAEPSSEGIRRLRRRRRLSAARHWAGYALWAIGMLVLVIVVVALLGASATP